MIRFVFRDPCDSRSSRHPEILFSLIQQHNLVILCFAMFNLHTSSFREFPSKVSLVMWRDGGFTRNTHIQRALFTMNLEPLCRQVRDEFFPYHGSVCEELSFYDFSFNVVFANDILNAIFSCYFCPTGSFGSTCFEISE
jgi:hypothetical protein